jgi:DHA2 family multidrug resistance protein
VLPLKQKKMNNADAIFKAKIPEWFSIASILAVLLTTILLFAISTADGLAAAGYYGAQPTDVQFSSLMFYASVASFAVVENRFFKRVVTKDYLAICIILEIAIAFCCYQTKIIEYIFILRFLQGLVHCGITSICLNLLFKRLKSEYAKEIGFTIFFGMILCVSPVTGLISAPFVESYEYNVVYKGIIFCFFPSATLLFSIINRVHLVEKKPLYNIDWMSFVLFSMMLVLIAYVLVYGQQKEWFEDSTIVYCIIGILFLFFTSIVRQKTLKRPAVNLDVFKSRNFGIGIVFLIILYIIRGALNLTSTYFVNVLGMDAIHNNEMLILNILGVVVGSTIAIRFFAIKKHLRLLWMMGFASLFLFFLMMCFLFSSEAGISHFYFPLFLHGLGCGMVITPIVLFITSSVEDHLTESASLVAVFVRYSTFGLSMAFINFYQLYYKEKHSEDLRRNLSSIDFNLPERLKLYQSSLIGKGIPHDEANRMAVSLLNKALQKQTFLQSCVSYYEWVAVLCVGTIILIAFQPVISRSIFNLKNKLPAAIGF